MDSESGKDGFYFILQVFVQEDRNTDDVCLLLMRLLTRLGIISRIPGSVCMMAHRGLASTRASMIYHHPPPSADGQHPAQCAPVAALSGQVWLSLNKWRLDPTARVSHLHTTNEETERTETRSVGDTISYLLMSWEAQHMRTGSFDAE